MAAWCGLRTFSCWLAPVPHANRHSCLESQPTTHGRRGRCQVLLVRIPSTEKRTTQKQLSHMTTASQWWHAHCRMLAFWWFSNWPGLRGNSAQKFHQEHCTPPCWQCRFGGHQPLRWRWNFGDCNNTKRYNLMPAKSWEVIRHSLWRAVSNIHGLAAVVSVWLMATKSRDQHCPMVLLGCGGRIRTELLYCCI